MHVVTLILQGRNSLLSALDHIGEALLAASIVNCIVWIALHACLQHTNLITTH